MSVFALARRPPQWLRVALAGLALALALNSIAHVTHQHDAATVSAVHSLACGYCVSFGALADAPRHSLFVPARGRLSIGVTGHVEAPLALLPRTSARPRAPPV